MEPPVGWVEAKPNPNVAMWMAMLGFGFASAQPTSDFLYRQFEASKA